MLAEAIELAKSVASKSPIATLSAKHFLNYSRDHTVTESLDYSLAWNMAMLQGTDMIKAGTAILQKKTPIYDNISNKSKL